MEDILTYRLNTLVIIFHVLPVDYVIHDSASWTDFN